ncbi:MAG: PEP-CTERM sorting domain-containing protein [Nitrosomonas sp.]|nr:PEP-CTERM sorting domain-containing protein [Nitrosomonas sp.]
MNRIKAFVIATSFIFTSASSAAIIKYEFTGTINHIPTGDYFGYYQEEASGYFSYDASWSSPGGVTPSGDGGRESYLSNNQNWSFGLFVGDLSFEASTINSPLAQLTVQNNGTFDSSGSGLIFDQFSFHGNTFDNYQWQVGLSEYLLQPDIPDVFASTEIPTNLILADVNSAFAILSVDSSRLRVTLDSLIAVPVPEPPTIALLGLGIAGFGFTRRYKQRIKANKYSQQDKPTLHSGLPLL